MNILLFTLDFKPLPGGVAEYGFRLAQGLAAAGHAVTVLTVKMKGGRIADRAAGLRVVRVPRARWLRELCFLFWLPYLALTRRIRVVLCLEWAPCAVLCALLRGWCGFTYGVFAFGNDVLDAAGSLRRRFPGVKRFAFSRGAHCFPISRYTRGVLDRDGVLKAVPKTTIIPGAVCPDRYRPLGRAQSHHGGSPVHLRSPGEIQSGRPVADPGRRWHKVAQCRRILLSVSRVVDNKGIDTLLKALPGIRTAFPRACAIVVGDGPHLGKMAALAASLGLEHSAFFAGPVPEEDLIRLYNLAEVVVMASRFVPHPPRIEGFGLVYLEANACEKPVIGGWSGGVPDAVVPGVTGLLVDPAEHAAVGRAACRLLADREFACKLGRQGRARVVRELNWDTVSARLAAVLEG